MQPKPLRLVLAFLATAVSVLAQGANLYSWNFAQAYSFGSSVEVPETAGGPAISFVDGASLAVDPDEQGRQVLVLSGTQSDWGRTKRNIEVLPAVQLRMRFKPDLQGASLQTLLTVSGAYELRYNRGRERLEFIVHLPDKKFRTVQVEAAAGIWNQALATYQDGKLRLTVGLSRAEETLPADLLPVPVSTTVRVGLVGPRPFTGSISEISISTP